MSSNEDDFNDQDGGLGMKKRRIQRACDICRRKKIRCNGVQMPGNRCSNCITYNYECTYIETAKKRGPPKGYVEGLENRIEKLEKLLKRLCPDEKLLRELDIAIDQDDFPLDQPPINPSPLVSTPVASTSASGGGGINKPSGRDEVSSRSIVDIATNVLRNYGKTPSSTSGTSGTSGTSTSTDPNNPNHKKKLREEEDDDAHLVIADNLKQLALEPKEYRFFGKSSGAMLIQTAIELKNEYEGKGCSPVPAPVMLGLKRNEFWTSHPWEDGLIKNEPRKQYRFPDPDLLPTLLDLYFENVNLYLPLLHRPSFTRFTNEGLHLHDELFGANVLLVCAIGSRFSDDPRVLLDGESNRHSSGWKWFDQVQIAKKSFLNPPTLYDLQFYSLSVQFLQGSSAPQACWSMVGIGIRLAQDVGAHRKRKTKDPMTVEDELWKRAFWVLVCIDRTVSAALGRPCAIHDEDFDVELPIDCDDEYWEHPDLEKRWKQPTEKPSRIAFFLCFLKLNQVLAFSLRTIYSINKSKILLGFVGEQWEQHIVAELDSALNHFVDSVPDHLRWDPNREDPKFFNQSVVLWTAYYHTQILIHRPFIPSPSRPSPLSFPSLAICTNAARSCIHVVDMQYQKYPMTSPQVQMAVFTSGIVLLLSIWGGKRSGLTTDPNKEMVDVHKCMAVLKGCEGIWHSAGRLWDILYELASVGDLPLPQNTPQNKRERDSDSPRSSAANSESANTPPPLPEGPRALAGSRRVAKPLQRNHHSVLATQQHRSQLPPHSSVPMEIPETLMLDQTHQQQQLHSSSPPSSSSHQNEEELYTLPLYSKDLGQIPLHGDVKFSTSLPSSHPHSHQHHPHSSLAQQHAPQHLQPIDPGGFWYSFEQAQMRSLGMAPGDGGAGGLNDNSIPPGSSSSGSLGGGGVLPPPSSLGSRGGDGMMGGGAGGQNDPDFIFEQLALGYPSPFPADLQMLNGMGMGLGMGMGVMGNGLLHPSQQPRYGVGGGGGGGGSGSGAGGQQDEQQQAYLDSAAMAIWSNTPTGFE